MSPESRDALATRIDYMEKQLNTEISHMSESIAQMADNISTMAGSISKMSERLADISLLTERSNGQSIQIDRLDRRTDVIEQKIPLYDQLVETQKWARRAFITAVFTALGAAAVAAYITY